MSFQLPDETHIDDTHQFRLYVGVNVDRRIFNKAVYVVSSSNVCL
jgi:hypothetical protein